MSEPDPQYDAHPDERDELRAAEEASSDTQPTPGPWIYREVPGGHYVCVETGVRPPNDVVLVEVYNTEGHSAEVNGPIIAAAGTAASELPDEFDAVAAIDALPNGLERVRRAIIDLLDGPPGDTDEPAIKSAISRLVEFLEDAGDEDVSEIVDDMMLDAARADE